jgi:hypothetical protein
MKMTIGKGYDGRTLRRSATIGNRSRTKKREEEEKAAQARADAIEAMETWFFEKFEDPQVEMPRDSEEQSFIFSWGGPFEASTPERAERL